MLGISNSCKGMRLCTQMDVRPRETSHGFAWQITTWQVGSAENPTLMKLCGCTLARVLSFAVDGRMTAREQMQINTGCVRARAGAGAQVCAVEHVTTAKGETPEQHAVSSVWQVSREERELVD